MKEVEKILQELERFKKNVNFKLEIRYNEDTKKFSASLTHIVDSEHPPATIYPLPSKDFIYDTIEDGLVNALGWVNETYYKYRRDLDE
tara:strand:- start:671 stop:934 length:264 start_codon:yes stop_codon:yes gene_type:complete